MIEHKNNTNHALDRIFEELSNMIDAATRLPLTDKILIEESDLSNILADLQEAIPKEVKNAGQVLEEQKSIINSAYADADKIVQQAKSEAERIVAMARAEADMKVQEEEIVKQAHAVAEDIKANALRYQEELKGDADDYSCRVKQEALNYADDMLGYLSKQLDSALQGLNENRSNIREEIQSIQSAAHAQLDENGEPEADE